MVKTSQTAISTIFEQQRNVPDGVDEMMHQSLVFPEQFPNMLTCNQRGRRAMCQR